MNSAIYTSEALCLLRKLISVSRISRQESQAADIMAAELARLGFEPKREGNNVWASCPQFDSNLPTLLLNAHLDTVRPVASWTRNPLSADLEEGVLYGLGSNDCGGGLVSLLQVFRILATDGSAGCNLIFLASAEEEVSGSEGITRVLPLIPEIDSAIVGEPTSMRPAIAEKGLMVVDAVAHGRSGHAAREEGVNAISVAIEDIEWLRGERFPKISQLLGKVKATVTIISAGTQHNVIPDRCEFTIDVRSNELYSNLQILNIMKEGMRSSLKARSLRLNSSRIDMDHPLVKQCLRMGMKPFGSPTLSDQALMPFPSIKIGPGDSARSHSADEYIKVEEIAEAIPTYLRLIRGAYPGKSGLDG